MLLKIVRLQHKEQKAKRFRPSPNIPLMDILGESIAAFWSGAVGNASSELDFLRPF
jgi:hypothetical protein